MAKKRKPGGGRKPSKPDYNPSAILQNQIVKMLQKKNYKKSSHKPQTAPKMIRGCVCGLCGPFYFVILIRMDVKFQG